MFIFIAIIIFIRMTARPCICLLSHVILSWSHGEKPRNKGEKWNVVIIFLPFLKVERCCYFNAMYFLFILFSRCADDEIDKEE